MKAVLIHEHGGSDKLKYETTEDPRPETGELVIRVKAAGVNHCDIDLREGAFGVLPKLPHIMGVDAAGEVAEIGPGVSEFKVGDRVAPHFMLSCGACESCRQGRENICLNAGILGVTERGSYAEYVKVKQTHVVRLPDELSFDDAVAAQVPLATAWEGLIATAKLRAGETALVNAAGGGIGSAGVQVAKLAGARVIATAGADQKLDRARELGADETINYNTNHIGEEARRLTGGLGVDVVLDMVGGDILIQSIDALAPGGRLASVGAHGGEQIEVDMIQFFRKHISMHGCGRSTKSTVVQVLDLAAQGKLNPVIHKKFPLAEVAVAHEIMESRDFFGRLILNP